MASVIVTGYGNMLTDKDLSTPGFAMRKKKGTTQSQELLVAWKEGTEPGDYRRLFWQCSGRK